MNTPIIFNPEIRLTEHFKLGEFTKSITAERLGISNEPGYEQMLALRHLCREVLEPLRQHYRHICKGCYWEVYGRRLRERYILKKVDRGDPMIRF